jgi:hypothetical protein
MTEAPKKRIQERSAPEDVSMRGETHPTEDKSRATRFSWGPLLAHFVLAIGISLLATASDPVAALVRPIVDFLAGAIPSISGYAAMSDHPQWARTYLAGCWIGAPYHLRFWWRLMAPHMAVWAPSQRWARFWFVTMGGIGFALGMLVMPVAGQHVTDASESVRTVAMLVSLMKASNVVLAVVGIGVVWTSAFLLGASVKAIQIRLTSGGR